MTMPADHVMFVVLAIVGPVWAATVGYRRLTGAAPADAPRVRRSVYRAAILLQWTLTAAVAALWLVTGRPWASLGLVPRPTWGLFGVALGTAFVIVFVARQRGQVLDDDDALAEVRERMRHVEPMLPRTTSEMRTFARLAITAGICEEVLYRGFMIFYLAQFTGVITAAVIASVLFGVGHAYQGWRGVLLTGMVGGFLSAVYLVSGSLFVPMVLHALMDLHSGQLAHVALVREAELQAEWEHEWQERQRAMELERAQAQELEHADDAGWQGRLDSDPQHAPLTEPRPADDTDTDRGLDRAAEGGPST